MNKRTETPLSFPLRTDNGTTHILSISGSLLAESYNRKLLEAARELAPSAVVVEHWDGLRRMPPFDEDDENDRAWWCSSSATRSSGPTRC